MVWISSVSNAKRKCYKEEVIQYQLQVHLVLHQQKLRLVNGTAIVCSCKFGRCSICCLYTSSGRNNKQCFLMESEAILIYLLYIRTKSCTFKKRY